MLSSTKDQAVLVLEAPMLSRPHLPGVEELKIPPIS
jgi:hypothetical protein